MRWWPAFALLLAPGFALAQGVRDAAAEYDAGTKAYRAKQYVEAAQSFESAYAYAPNSEALRAAIVARQKAKQEVRAATLAALAQRAHSDDPDLAKAAEDALKARTKLGAVIARCNPACSVTVDGQLASVVDASESTVFLAPGSHKVRLEWQDVAESFEVEATPGSEQSLAADKPAKPVPPVEPTPPKAKQPTPEVVKPTPPPPEPVKKKPVHKAVFFVAAGLTVAAGAGTAVSGVLTQTSPGKDAVRAECVGLGTDCETYQRGQRAELRTNVLLGVTGGLALTTVVLAFLTDFSSSSAQSKAGARAWPKAALTPYADPRGQGGGLSLGGSF